MVAAPFLLGLLLITSARTAAGDDAATLPHLELPAGTLDSGRGHGSDAPRQGLMDIMSMSCCGRFAGLVAATPNASDILEERIVTDGGLTVFCPSDKAVARFEPTFRALADRDRLAVLLMHGVAARYGPAQIAASEFLVLRTLAAADAATNENQTIAIFRGRVWPSPTSCKGDEAKIIKTVSSEEGPHPVAVYLIDAVLVPCVDEAAAGGGYLGWLDIRIPLWVALNWVAAAIVGCLLGGPVLSWVARAIVGFLGGAWRAIRRIKKAVMH